MRVSRAAAALVLCCCAIAVAVAKGPRPKISEDRELTDLDVTGWDCLGKPEGTAKTPDGVERNRMKNRDPIDLTKAHVEALDTASFLKLVAPFDSQTAGKHRSDLGPAEKGQLDALEKKVVSLTGYLVLAYVGPPETTNCASSDFHDWHLELFEKPSDHAPAPGDPTPIICEITPRTQRAIFRDNIRIQSLTAFFRRPDVTDEPTGHAAKKIRVTGFLTWDDDHNGKADVGTKIERIAANRYHQPWRSTAWEIHPAIKIEALDKPEARVEQSTPAPAASIAIPPATVPAPTPNPTPAPVQPLFATLTQPIKIQIPYGETVLPPGTKLPIVSRDAQSVTVDYMGQRQTIPVASVTLR